MTTLEEIWGSIDDYSCTLFGGDDAILRQVLENCEREGLPAIQVSPSHGQFLRLLARIRSARRILEIGTLGGYSTIWLAGALPPDGKIISLEFDAHHADVARRNVVLAGLEGKVEIRVGDAKDTLAQLAGEGCDLFDMIFIDAEKSDYPAYLMLALKLCAPGALIIADNVVRRGALADMSSTDPRVLGVRKFNELAAKEPALSGTILQTVGDRGYDGFTILSYEHKN